MSRERATVTRPAGAIIISTEMGKVIQLDTKQCVHCGMHWEHKPGSGKTRGHCFNCKGPICGPKCQDCYPKEKQYEDMTRGIWLPPHLR